MLDSSLKTILLNFSHPLTPDQREALGKYLTTPEIEVIEVRTELDTEREMAPQVTALIDQCGINGVSFQSASLLVNLPGLGHAAALVLAELHGRIGYFPPTLRLKPLRDSDGRISVPPHFVVAEILNLQNQRELGRARRWR